MINSGYFDYGIVVLGEHELTKNNKISISGEWDSRLQKCYQYKMPYLKIRGLIKDGKQIMQISRMSLLEIIKLELTLLLRCLKEFIQKKREQT